MLIHKGIPTSTYVDFKKALVERDLIVEDWYLWEGTTAAISSGGEGIFKKVKIFNNSKLIVKGNLSAEEIVINDGGELVIYDGAEVEIYGS